MRHHWPLPLPAAPGARAGVAGAADGTCAQSGMRGTE